MSDKQPQWQCIANLGDVNPITYGGYFVYRDKTGVYTEEAERLDYDGHEWTVHRIMLDRCTLTDGILSDNKYHPNKPAWFAQPESERAARPQDSTYLSNVASYVSTTVEILQAQLCSADPVERADAYRSILSYHGWENGDSDPLKFTKRSEVRKRYGATMRQLAALKAKNY